MIHYIDFLRIIIWPVNIEILLELLLLDAHFVESPVQVAFCLGIKFAIPMQAASNNTESVITNGFRPAR